jgi:hypothetical protein
MLLGQNIRRTDGEVRDMKKHSPRNPSQYHMKTCHKGKLSNRNGGSKDQGAVTKIYAKFTSMPYACKEHIQVYVVAK